jgi:hypothetical protein
VVPRIGGATAPAVAPAALPDRTWTVAVTDDDHHEMTLAQIVDAYAAEKIDAETFIWRDGMQDWLMPFEIGDIATALRARRLVPRTNAASSAGGTLPFGEDPPPGAWREPGRWDRNDAPPEEPSFDDVTVAMEAPKAKALLQAVSSEDAAAKAADAEAAKPIRAKSDEPTMIAPKPDEPTIAAPVTPASLGFGLDDEGPKAAAPGPTESITAIAESLEREPERLPFELASTAGAARAALRSNTNETGANEPRDLFARKANENDAPATESDEDGGDAAAKALTGARNESSVLFSLDQLAKPAAKAASPSTPKKKDEAALLLGDAPAAAPVAGLGGGLFGATTNMAAPDFTAPPAPSVPPPAAKATSGAPGAAEKGSRGAGVWIGAIVALAALGGGAYFLTRSPTPQPVPAATATATATATTPAPAASPTEPAATASAAPEATASASAAPADSAGPASSASATAAPGASASAAATGASGASTAAPAATATGAAAPAQPKAAQPASAAPKASVTAETAPATGPDFDKDAAMATLATAAANSESQCASEEGTHGTGKVTVTFANSGRATNALVSGDFAGSALGGCIARIFRGAKVPAFGGEQVRVSKTVRIP